MTRPPAPGTARAPETDPGPRPVEPAAPAPRFTADTVTALLDAIDDDPNWEAWGSPLVGRPEHALAATLLDILEVEDDDAPGRPPVYPPREPGDTARLRATCSRAFMATGHPDDDTGVRAQDLYDADAALIAWAPGSDEDEAWRAATRQHLMTAYPGLLAAYGDALDLDKAARIRRASVPGWVALPAGRRMYLFRFPERRAAYALSALTGVPHA